MPTATESLTLNKISDLENVLGATGRQNKYRVTLTFPGAVGSNVDAKAIDVLAKSATAPQKEIGVIELWNQGRKLPIPGDTTFDNTWEVSFYLGETHDIRTDLLKWQDACDNFYRNIHTGDPAAIFATVLVEQLDSAMNVTAQYTLYNVWPSVVGEIAYDDSAENSPIELSVTFTYSHWVVGTGDYPDYSNSYTATLNPTAL